MNEFNGSHYKENGNKLFKLNDYQGALEMYNKAI